MLTEEDYEQVARLLGTVGEPSPADALERREALAKGLAELVNADIYLWFVGVLNTQNIGEAMPTSMVDGGWKSEAQRTAFYVMAVDTPVGRAIQQPVHQQTLQAGAATGRIVDLVPNEIWENVKQEFYDFGYVDSIMSMRSIGKNGFSCLGLHREVGKPEFSLRERFLVQAVFQNVDWIHYPGFHHDAGATGLTLTHRQREVLLLLLRGKSRKAIAAGLGLSEHTVVDYQRQIYRRFDVKSHSELLAQFVMGSPAQSQN